MKRRKDGYYSRQVYVGKKPATNKDGTPRLNADGDQVYIKDFVTVYGHTQEEVNEAYMQKKLSLGKGIDIKSANDSWGVWANRYLAKKQMQRDRGTLSHGYVYSEEVNVAHLSPMSSRPISKITLPEVQAIIDNLGGWHDGRPPLKRESLVKIRRTAKRIFRLAIAARLFDYNPAEDVEIPGDAKKERVEPISDEQMQWIRETEHRAKRAAMIMLYGGARRGEVIALTRGDFDLDNGYMYITKAVEFVKGKPILKGPKTEYGRRRVDIPKVLADYLRDEFKKDDCLYVIHRKNGTMLTLSSWRRMWESYMSTLNYLYGYSEDERKAKNITSRFNPNRLSMRINTFNAHQLRHTFCTLLYLAGYRLTEARDQMGHADIKTTANIYTHLDKIFDRPSKGKLDNLLGQYKISMLDNISLLNRGISSIG